MMQKKRTEMCLIGQFVELFSRDLLCKGKRKGQMLKNSILLVTLKTRLFKFFCTVPYRVLTVRDEYPPRPHRFAIYCNRPSLNEHTSYLHLCELLVISFQALCGYISAQGRWRSRYCMWLSCRANALNIAVICLTVDAYPNRMWPVCTASIRAHITLQSLSVYVCTHLSLPEPFMQKLSRVLKLA